MNTVHQNHKHLPKDSLQTRTANGDLNKRRIARGNNLMEHTQNQAKRNEPNHYPWYTDLSQGTHLPSIGYDNSDKNKLRQSIGSCTDTIATERKFFGPWQIPNPDRQEKLVNRLAPHKLPAPADPRFDAWVNHFQHYWDIGANAKPARKSLQKSSNTETGLKVDSSISENQTAHNDRKFYVTRYHRLMGQRPRRLRLQATDCQEENPTDRVDESAQVSETYSNKLGGKHGVNNRRTNHSPDYERGFLLSGLDRRYTGLQSMNKQQVEEIVRRLTRMTSAYNAKFSPNPHVWVDTSPGAHMVAKREHTIA